MKIAIVGVTGLVGNKITWLLEKRNIPIEDFIPIASKESLGKGCLYKSKSIPIIDMELFMEKYIYHQHSLVIFFTSTAEISKTWIPKILKINKNAFIIDNSSYFRLHENIPLVIPEINADKIMTDTRLISNPNCSTAQLVMVLYPLHLLYKIKRVVVSTYQSVSGAGYRGEQQLEYERKSGSRKNIVESTGLESVFGTRIDLNCIPLCDKLDLRTGYTGEEIKLERETPKILDCDVKVTATAVRVPVFGGHSESVNIEFYNNPDISNIENLLNNTKGIKVKEIPCPFDVEQDEDVWVGRIRKDFSQDNTINLWIVADNLMKGAALNAVQILEYLINKNYVSLD